MIDFNETTMKRFAHSTTKMFLEMLLLTVHMKHHLAGAFLAGRQYPVCNHALVPRPFIKSNQQPCQRTSCSSSQDKMSMVDASVIPGNMKHAAVMGGDFAGIAVNLDEKGQAIPLPELWVPASMQEWGQVPDFVETIVSEDDDNGDSESFTRHMLTILPETGCGVDNLDVVKSVEKIERAASFLQSGVECLASIVDTKSKTADSKNQWRIETVFDCNSVTTPLHRIRLSVLVERVVANHLEEDGECRWRMVSSSKFSWPSIHIVWERRFAEASSSGTVADGGGLDGQRVGRWMGSVIQKQASSFIASTYPRLTENEPGCQNSEEVLQLPGNLTLSINFDQNKTDKTGKALSLQMRHCEWD